jgi:Domain of unknown function (DUF4282)
MTNPPDHGQGPGPQAPGPYGPPPGQHPGRVPDPRPPGPGPRMGTGPQQHIGQQPPTGAPPPSQEEWAPPQRTDKGVFGTLFDANFDHMITPKLVKLWYVLVLMLITLQCVLFLGIGLWIANWEDFWAWGLIMMLASPLVWLFELLLLRIFMEAVVVRFKQAEHLLAIKNKI